MIRKTCAHVISVIVALTLAGCFDPPEDGGPAPDPLLYEITDSDGEVEGWMLGTIHALPDGVKWRTENIDLVVGKADYLIVEVAGLEERRSMAATFQSLANSPDQPPIEQRVYPEWRPALSDLIDRSGYSEDDFDDTETWAAALMLAQVDAPGDPANGVDRAIIRDFAGREVREFEGALAQLRIFDRLEEADQRDLLEGVLEETGKLRDDPARLRNAWLSGDEKALEEATYSGIMADIELRDALLVQRNLGWAAVLDEELEGGPRPLVAIGTAHLVGPDSVTAMLEERGYSVKRLGR